MDQNIFPAAIKSLQLYKFDKRKCLPLLSCHHGNYMDVMSVLVGCVDVLRYWPIVHLCTSIHYMWELYTVFVLF